MFRHDVRHTAVASRPRPVIQSIAWISNRIEIAASAVPGGRYGLAYKFNVEAAPWTPLPNEVQANGLTVILIDPAPADARRFYSVVALPTL